MTIKATAADKQAVTQFNSLHPIGTPVMFWPGYRAGEGWEAKTRSQAHLSNNLTPVVLVEGYVGRIALTHVEPIVSAA